MSNSSNPSSHGPGTDRTSLSLIEKIRSNDTDAWNRMVDLYGPLVFYWCRQKGLGEQDASDVVQDVLMAVARGIGGFRRDREGDTFRGWLRVVTRSQIAMHFRKKGRSEIATGGSTFLMQIQNVPDPEVNGNEDEIDEDYEKTSLFRRGLQLIQTEFEPSTWQAFWMIVIDQKSHDQVAETLQLTAGAVRQAKYRVLKRLKSEFGEILG